MRLLPYAISLMLAGCAGGSQSDFQQGAAALDQFNRDSAECELRGEENRTAGGYYGLIGVASYSESYAKVYDACMRAKGYEAVQ